MGIADNLTKKELELANLVDFFNDNFADRKAGKKKAAKLEAIILNLIKAINSESSTKYAADSMMGNMHLWKDGSAISNREFYDELHLNQAEEEKEGFDLEALCRQSVIEENKAIDGAFSKLETKTIDWGAVDLDVRGHPSRNFSMMLDMNSHYVMHSEDRAKSRIKILAYGQKIVDLKIITQEDFSDAIAVNEARLEKANADKDGQPF
jgi:hypothetical protein